MFQFVSSENILMRTCSMDKLFDSLNTRVSNLDKLKQLQSPIISLTLFVIVNYLFDCLRQHLEILRKRQVITTENSRQTKRSLADPGL